MYFYDPEFKSGSLYPMSTLPLHGREDADKERNVQSLRATKFAASMFCLLSKMDCGGEMASVPEHENHFVPLIFQVSQDENMTDLWVNLERKVNGQPAISSCHLSRYEAADFAKVEVFVCCFGLR